jgi:hypothetical protein
MLTQHESFALAPAASRRTSQKLLQLLRKRLRQIARVTIVLAICLAVAASALAIWWLRSLDGLPDIGDPFDVNTMRGLTIPDDENALTFLRRAQEKLIRLEEMPRGVLAGAPTVDWSQADPKLRAWVESNHQALQLFFQGADRSDGNWQPASQLYWQNHPMLQHGSLMWIALLEGGRRGEVGDTAGAWDCYRAVLRMATHTRRRGSLFQRRDLDCYWNGLLRLRLGTWAADPRTAIPQLRNALEEVLKCEPTPDWDSFAIKAGYLEMMRSLEQPVHPFVQQEVGWGYDYHLGDMKVSSEVVDHLDAARRFLLREPERSRRVLRLLYANWLAHAETREPRPRKPAVRASFPMLTSTNPIRKATASVPLYPLSPLAPAGARSLPPREVASWLVTTNDLELRILVASRYNWPWSPDRLRGRDRRAYRELVMMLAEEIYHREHGALPPSEEALVGTYLKSLPDDGSADLADEMTPTVE